MLLKNKLETNYTLKCLVLLKNAHIYLYSNKIHIKNIRVQKILYGSHGNTFQNMSTVLALFDKKVPDPCVRT